MVRSRYATRSSHTHNAHKARADRELRERRLAHIVRDFMEAFVLAARIRNELREGTLGFERVERLVGDAEDSLLYRLKEECHALFRHAGAERPRTEVDAEELFDLAVGALFHEAMKFREGFYVAMTYGPRLERMIAEGTASGALARTCRKVLEDGRMRMRESADEAWALFGETREQLRTLLRQLDDAGSVARSLVEEPRRTEYVFGVPLHELLVDLYQEAERGLALAIESLLSSGHYQEARGVLGREELRASDVCRAALPYARGMAAYYSGDYERALDELEVWADGGMAGHETRLQHAQRALAALAKSIEGSEGALGQRALALSLRLTPGPSS
jgi:hypothetical protein